MLIIYTNYQLSKALYYALYLIVKVQFRLSEISCQLSVLNNVIYSLLITDH